MIDVYEYQELNPDKFKREIKNEGAITCAIGVFNFFTPLEEKNILRLKKIVDASTQTISVSIIDFQKTNESTKHSPSLFSLFPRLRIISVGKASFLEGINLFVRETKADFIFLMSSEIFLETMDLKRLMQSYLKSPALFGWMPLVTQWTLEDEIVLSEKRVENGYDMRFAKNKTHVSLSKKEDGEKTMAAYGCCFLFERVKFLHLGGFDTDYKNIFVASIDLVLRAHFRGYACCCTSALVVGERFEKKKHWFYGSDASYKKDIFWLSFKNVSRNTLFLTIFLIMKGFFTLNVLFLKKLIRTLRKRKNNFKNHF